MYATGDHRGRDRSAKVSNFDLPEPGFLSMEAIAARAAIQYGAGRRARWFDG